MSQTRCSQCGSPVDADHPNQPCPACLLELAVQGDSVCSCARTEEVESVSSTQMLELEQVQAAFPQLEIIGPIGRGGMGTVFKAKQPKLDRFIALKILSSELAGKPTFAERFAREGKLLARLSHPNIVTVYDFGQTEMMDAKGQPITVFYLLLEYVEGVNLRLAMREERFRPEQAIVIVPKICEALQYAHEQGVVHRDIKPENILLDTKGRIKIADFGLGKLTVAGEKGVNPDSDLKKENQENSVEQARELQEHFTATGQILGTPSYMAPEQFNTPQNVDHRADIYSLGVVFYELLTGELPQGFFPVPSAKTPVGAEIDEIVLKALKKDRELRQQSAQELKTEVESVHFPSEPKPIESVGSTETAESVEPIGPVEAKQGETAVQPKPAKLLDQPLGTQLTLLAIVVFFAFPLLLSLLSIGIGLIGGKTALGLSAHLVIVGECLIALCLIYLIVRFSLKRQGVRQNGQNITNGQEITDDQSAVNGKDKQNAASGHNKEGEQIAEPYMFGFPLWGLLVISIFVFWFGLPRLGLAEHIWVTFLLFAVYLLVRSRLKRRSMRQKGQSASNRQNEQNEKNEQNTQGNQSGISRPSGQSMGPFWPLLPLITGAFCFNSVHLTDSSRFGFLRHLCLWAIALCVLYLLGRFILTRRSMRQKGQSEMQGRTVAPNQPGLPFPGPAQPVEPFQPFQPVPAQPVQVQLVPVQSVQRVQPRRNGCFSSCLLVLLFCFVGVVLFAFINSTNPEGDQNMLGLSQLISNHSAREPFLKTVDAAGQSVSIDYPSIPILTFGLISLCLTLAVIALFIWLIVKIIRQNTNNGNASPFSPTVSTPTRFCTNCGSAVPEGSYACPSCGFAARSKRNFCYNCGCATNPEQVICTKCGVSLQQPFFGGIPGLSGMPGSGPYNRVAAGLLALLLGWIGVHKFYLGSWGWGLVYLLFFWSGITWIVGIIEGVLFLTMSDQAFDQRYNQTQTSAFRW
ncbi:MAG: protein kinase domain-containing protein [Thermoguttaceae bacterium]